MTFKMKHELFIINNVLWSIKDEPEDNDHDSCLEYLKNNHFLNDIDNKNAILKFIHPFYCNYGIKLN